MSTYWDKIFRKCICMLTQKKCTQEIMIVQKRYNIASKNMKWYTIISHQVNDIRTKNEILFHTHKSDQN